MGLGASETAVAVEIAESVRHTLMEDESRRAPTHRSREAAVGHRGGGLVPGSGRPGMEMSLAAHIQLGQYNWDVPGEFHAVAVEIAESVRRSLMEDDTRWAPFHLGTGVPVLREIEPMIFPSSHRSLFQASRFSHDFTDEHAWYAEIAEAVVGSLAEEAQHLQGPVAEQSRDIAEPVDQLVNVGVDPDALAGLAETVLHFQDTAMLDHYSSMLNPEPVLRAQDTPEHTQPHGCLRAADPPLGSLHLAGFSVSDSDIAGIAHAVLRSLDEDTAIIPP